MRLTLVDKAKPATAVPFRHYITKTHAARLGFRFRNGARRSLSYVALVETQFNPSVGIILDFIGARVTIHGRNLEPIYDGIEDEDIGELIEQHTRDLALEERETWIDRIEWQAT